MMTEARGPRPAVLRGAYGWFVGLVACLVALLVLGGCATIPTSGPVHEGGDLRLQRVDDGVPFIGQPPLRGASPEDVVRGFLQSSADFVDDHAVAREYLTPTVRQRWQPQAGTVVLDRLSAEEAVIDGASATVTVKGTEVGRIDVDGGFRRTPVGTTLSRTFRLRRLDGQWRVSDLEDGLALSSANVLETYRAVSLYFLAPSGTRVVPDTVLIPELPGITAKLVARLLRGPTASLQGSVGTAFPAGTELEVSSVPVSDGVATVRLDKSALQANDRAREQMSAQLVWTLRQLPDVRRVRIMAGNEDLVVSGVAVEQDRSSWRTYDPDALVASPSAYVVRAGRVGRLVDGKFERVLGIPDNLVLRTPAGSLDGSRLAAVSADGHNLLVGRPSRDSTPATRVTGADLGSPSWDPGSDLWVVDRSTGALWYLADGADKPQEVTVPRPLSGNRRLTSVVVSRDGTRVAMVVGTGKAARLMIGGVQRVETTDPDVVGGQAVALVNVEEPLPDLRSVRDVSWADASTLAVLGVQIAADGGDPGEPEPAYLGTDGYRVRAVEPLPGLVGLTAAPPQQDLLTPLVGATDDGQLWQYTSGGGWVVLGQGSDPAYPG